MFQQRIPFFVNTDKKTKSIDDKVNDSITPEIQDIVSKRDKKRLTIEQMVQDIEEALEYIVYVDTSTQQNQIAQPNQPETSSYSDDVEIL